jgi:hypothetical protein
MLVASPMTAASHRLSRRAAEQRDELAPVHRLPPRPTIADNYSRVRAVHRSKSGRSMTALGQTLPSRDFCGTAALRLKPDIGWRGWHGRKVP